MAENNTYGPFEVDQRIKVHSNYYAGKMGSRFYTALRNDKKILGVKCEKCDKVYWPPRETCGRCFSLLTPEDLWEIGPQGTLESYTIVRYSEPVHPVEAPFAYGIVKLDNADTSIAHLLGEVDFDKLTIGMRLEAVFADERKGNIHDIKYFKAVE